MQAAQENAQASWQARWQARWQALSTIEVHLQQLKVKCSFCANPHTFMYAMNARFARALNIRFTHVMKEPSLINRTFPHQLERLLMKPLKSMQSFRALPLLRTKLFLLSLSSFQKILDLRISLQNYFAKWKWLQPVMKYASSEQGDVPGWVLVVLMTTGLVTAIWTIAAPRLTTILRNSLDSMNGIR